jgi:hypothetical protein
MKPKLKGNRRHATQPAFADTAGKAHAQDPQPQAPQAPHHSPHPQPPMLPRTPRQLSGAVVVSIPHQASTAQDLPMQPVTAPSVDDVRRHINKALAAPHALDVKSNPVRGPGGEKRLPLVYAGLSAMIDAQANPVDRARLYGELAVQLLHYGGVDKALGWSQDRFEAAFRLLREIDQKLASPHEDMRSMLVWTYVKKTVLELDKVGDPHKKAAQKNIESVLLRSYRDLHRTLTQHPEENSTELQALLLKAVSPG